jgi:hypothetical protein
MSADLLGVSSVNSSRSAALNSVDKQLNSALNTVKFNLNAKTRALRGKLPVDVKSPKLASYVTFPDSEVAAIVPYAEKTAVGAHLPSNQGFVDWLCQKAVQEVRKLPLFGVVPKQLLKDLCVLGINSGIKSVPKLKQFVTEKLSSRRMARITSKPVVSSKRVPRSVVSAPSARNFTSTTVSAPVSVSRRIGARNRPKFSNRTGNVVITHTEFIGNLYSSGTTLTYNASSYVINAGNFGTFPWLSTFSSNFDKYKMHKLVVHLVSNQPTSIAGRIGVGVDYDSTDPLPSDRGEFFNLTHHQETSPWDSLVFNVPIKPEEKFVNSHTTTDSKLIDCGQIVVMADQIVDTSANLADIIVEYTVELIQPQQAIFATQTFTGDNSATWSALSVYGPVLARMKPTTSTTVVEFTLPTGYYMANVMAYDAAGTYTFVAALHDAVGRQFYMNDTNGFMKTGVFKVTGPDGKFRLTLGTLTLPDIDEMVISFTRISAAVYSMTSSSYHTTFGTY